MSELEGLEFRFSIDKMYEFDEHDQFEVTCVDKGAEGDAVVAKLTGIKLNADRYLEAESEGLFGDELDEVLECYSGHAHRAFLAIAWDQALLISALNDEEIPVTKFTFIYLERVWVDPSYRSKGLALRLMREAKRRLHGDDVLAVLTAYPDGKDITPEDQLRLAAYYERDPQVGFKALSQEKYPGILVADWGDKVETVAGQSST